VSDAYEVAKAGGRHSGLIRRFRDDTDHAIAKSIQPLQRQIDLHLA
jgi:hypothetical protein